MGTRSRSCCLTNLVLYTAVAMTFTIKDAEAAKHLIKPMVRGNPIAASGKIEQPLEAIEQPLEGPKGSNSIKTPSALGIPTGLDWSMAIADSYTFPDTLKLKEPFLSLTVNKQSLCHLESNRMCLELIVPDESISLSSIEFAVGKDYRTQLQKCRSSKSRQNCSQTCQYTDDVRDYTYLSTPSRAKKKRQVEDLPQDQVRCGLGYRQYGNALFQIYPHEPLCPWDVTYECGIKIMVLDRRSNYTFDFYTRIKLTDSNEPPDCSSPVTIREPSTWTNVDCVDRDAELMSRCHFPGCVSYGKIRYRLPKGHKSRGLTTRKVNGTEQAMVNSKSGPFTMYLEVSNPGAKKVEKKVISYHRRYKSNDPCDSNSHCGGRFSCEGGKCVCPSNQYWDSEMASCNLKKTFHGPCATNYQCWSNLLCLKNTCVCDDGLHWNEGNLDCQIRNILGHLGPSVPILRYEGESAVLICSPPRNTLTPEAPVTWQRPGMGFVGSGIRLLLKILQHNDAGSYLCMLGGNVTKHYDVRIYTRESTIPTRSFEVNVEIDMPLTLRSKIVGYHPLLRAIVKRKAIDYYPNMHTVVIRHEAEIINASHEHYFSIQANVIERYEQYSESHRQPMRIRRFIDNIDGRPTLKVQLQELRYPFINGGLSKPIETRIEGDNVRMDFRFYVFYSHVKPKYEIVWQFGNKFLNTTQSGSHLRTNVSQSVLVLPALDVKSILLSVTLDIVDITPSFAGEYRCHLISNVPSLGEDIVTTFNDIPLFRRRPRVDMSPLSAVAPINSTVTCSCRFRFAYRVKIELNGQVREDLEMDGETITLKTSFKTGSNRTEDVVICYAVDPVVVRKKLIIRRLPNNDPRPICEAGIDDRGTFWAASPSQVISIDSCPDKYVGNVTRTCSQDGQWLPSNYSACRREDLIQVEDRLQFLKVLKKPSMEDVNSIASDLVRSVAFIPVRGEDIDQVVEILSDLGNVVEEEEKQEETRSEALLSDEALMDVANLTDKLLTANQSDWTDAETSVKTSALHKPAGRLMVAVEKLVSSTLNNNVTSQTIIQENLAIKRATVPDGKDIQFPILHEKEYRRYDRWVQQSQSTAFLSHKAFPQSEVSDKVRYAVLLYRGIAEKMQAPQEKTYNATSICDPTPRPSLSGKRVMSDILSFSLNAKVDTLSPKLDLAFKVPEDGIGPVCGFLDVATGGWSTDGCETVILEDGVVECFCDHLTNFAVLMSPAGTAIASRHHQILGVISLIGCTISIVFLVITIFVYVLFWRHLKNDLSVLHVNLSVCLILSYVVFLVGIDQICRETLCTVIAAILHYLLLAVFFLMLCEGIEILLSVSVIFSRKSFLWVLMLVSYGFPAILVAISLGSNKVQGYRSEQYCWLSVESGTIWAFIVPALVIIVANIIIGVIVLRVMAKTAALRNMDQADRAKRMTKAVLSLSAVLGAGWVFGIMAINDDTIIFQYLFALLNSLQGLFIFIFHCLLSHKVRSGFSSLYRQMTSRSKTSRTDTGTASRAKPSFQEQREMLTTNRTLSE